MIKAVRAVFCVRNSWICAHRLITGVGMLGPQSAVSTDWGAFKEGLGLL